MIIICIFGIVSCYDAKLSIVLVDKTIIDGWTRMQGLLIPFSSDIPVIQKIQVQLFQQYDWALLYCIVSPTQMLLTEGKISPLYKNQTTEYYSCFTKLPKDYVFGSQIDGTKIYGSVSLEIRNERNLARGYNMGSLSHCIVITEQMIFQCGYKLILVSQEPFKQYL